MIGDGQSRKEAIGRNVEVMNAKCKTRVGFWNCYAPTNDNDDEIKDAFYEQLQREIDSIPGHDMKVVMGDLNAKVGNNNTSYDRAMGKYGCGVMNENGERLVEFCSINNLVIGGTLFQHKDIHTLTWYSPNGRDRNQIDHIMINGTWRRSLQDVRVLRGADAASDHHLVLAVIQVKLRKTGASKVKQPRYDIDKLKDPRVKGAFLLELRNSFQVLADLEEETQTEQDKFNEEWQRVKTAYQKSSETCLGTKKRERKEWMTEDTWQTVVKRREAKKTLFECKVR
nr:craniofacial development protein 2-like [Lytechinus pictus]